MRRTEREVKENKEVLKVIDTCNVCRVGMWDGEQVYIVPMNFGRRYENGELTLYFHGAKEGRKYDVIKANPKVGFEMDCEHELITADSACAYGYHFASVIGTGYAEIVTDTEEKKEALSLLMQWQTGEVFTFNDRQAAAVTVLKITSKEFTCKRN